MVVSNCRDGAIQTITKTDLFWLDNSQINYKLGDVWSCIEELEWDSNRIKNYVNQERSAEIAKNGRPVIKSSSIATMTEGSASAKEEVFED